MKNILEKEALVDLCVVEEPLKQLEVEVALEVLECFRRVAHSVDDPNAWIADAAGAVPNANDTSENVEDVDDSWVEVCEEHHEEAAEQQPVDVEDVPEQEAVEFHSSLHAEEWKWEPEAPQRQTERVLPWIKKHPQPSAEDRSSAPPASWRRPENGTFRPWKQMRLDTDGWTATSSASESGFRLRGDSCSWAQGGQELRAFNSSQVPGQVASAQGLQGGNDWGSSAGWGCSGGSWSSCGYQDWSSGGGGTGGKDSSDGKGAKKPVIATEVSPTGKSIAARCDVPLAHQLLRAQATPVAASVRTAQPVPNPVWNTANIVAMQKAMQTQWAGSIGNFGFNHPAVAPFSSMMDMRKPPMLVPALKPWLPQGQGLCPVAEHRSDEIVEDGLTMDQICNFKTRLCKQFAAGSCSAGDECFDAHGVAELQRAWKAPE